MTELFAMITGASSIVILILLFILKEKKINKNKKSDLKERYKKNLKKGNEYEDKVGLYYEKMNYNVQYRGIHLKRADKGIDLIAENENQILLIQCKNWSKTNSITHKIVKEIYGNCAMYIKKKKIKKGNIMFILAIPNKEILSKGAEYVFIENYKDFRYKIIKY